MASPSPHRAHWTLDPEVLFLNHGSFGACPRPVLEAQSRYRALMEREPLLFLHREIEGRIDTARAALAAFLRADPADLAFVNNATTGVNAVLRSMELSPEDELLDLDQGYNACRNVVRFVAQRSGASVVTARVPFPIVSEDEVVESVLAAVSQRTRLALIDHITSPTGLVLPVERIVRELADRAVDTLVDGAHAPGMLDLDLGALGAAYYTGNCHKWICAPKGAAFLWVRRDLQPSVRPAVISHGANAMRTDRSRFQLEFDWEGTDDPTAVLSVPDALEFMGSLFPGGWPELRRHNRDLALAGRSLLCEALDVPPPAPESMIGSLAAVTLPLLEGEVPDADPLQKALFDRHRIEVPVYTWPEPRVRILRISAQAYNAVEEYRALAEVVGRS